MNLKKGINPRVYSDPDLGLYTGMAICMYMTFIVKQVYWYISQISGERLQDHWSSGYTLRLVNANYLWGVK